MKLYTDGATSNNGYEGSVGGWAYLLVNEVDNILLQASGKVVGTTNNICEMIAIIRGCSAASSFSAFITVCSDSAYIINCYKEKWYKKWQSNGWLNSKGQPVANKELWEQLIPFFESDKFEFEKVQGHSGNHYNEIVDKMAVEAKERKDG